MSTMRGEVAELVVDGAHGRLPGRALVELAVGEEVDRPATSSPGAAARAPSRPRRCRPWPERAAGDLHSRGVGGHAGHRQPGVVGPVGVELGDGDDPGLGEGGVQADGVVAGGQQEPVAALPVRVVGAVAELVGVDGGEHVGGTEGLADVALALRLAHVQDVVAHAVGGVARPASRSVVDRGASCGRLRATVVQGDVGGGPWSRRSIWRSRGPQVSRVTGRRQADRRVEAEQQGRARSSRRTRTAAW